MSILRKPQGRPDGGQFAPNPAPDVQPLPAGDMTLTEPPPETVYTPDFESAFQTAHSRRQRPIPHSLDPSSLYEFRDDWPDDKRWRFAEAGIASLREIAIQSVDQAAHDIRACGPDAYEPAAADQDSCNIVLAAKHGSGWADELTDKQLADALAAAASIIVDANRRSPDILKKAGLRIAHQVDEYRDRVTYLEQTVGDSSNMDFLAHAKAVV